MFETEVFRKQMYCIVTLLGLFGVSRNHTALPAVIWHPHSDSAPGELRSPCYVTGYMYPWLGTPVLDYIKNVYISLQRDLQTYCRLSVGLGFLQLQPKRVHSVIPCLRVTVNCITLNY